MTIDQSPKQQKTGWFRTWSDVIHDGVYWLNGKKLGRVYMHHDKERWQWMSWVGNNDSNIVGSKEEAQNEVELRAKLANQKIRDTVSD